MPIERRLTVQVETAVRCGCAGPGSLQREISGPPGLPSLEPLYVKAVLRLERALAAGCPRCGVPYQDLSGEATFSEAAPDSGE